MPFIELTRKEPDGFHRIVVNFANVIHFAPLGMRTRVYFVSAHSLDETSSNSITVEESTAHIEALLALSGQSVARLVLAAEAA
jgi:hypothetical protein